MRSMSSSCINSLHIHQSLGIVAASHLSHRSDVKSGLHWQRVWSVPSSNNSSRFSHHFGKKLITSCVCASLQYLLYACTLSNTSWQSTSRTTLTPQMKNGKSEQVTALSSSEMCSTSLRSCVRWSQALPWLGGLVGWTVKCNINEAAKRKHCATRLCWLVEYWSEISCSAFSIVKASMSWFGFSVLITNWSLAVDKIVLTCDLESGLVPKHLGRISVAPETPNASIVSALT